MEPPTGTTDGISASRKTVRVPSPNISFFLKVFRGYEKTDAKARLEGGNNKIDTLG